MSEKVYWIGSSVLPLSEDVTVRFGDEIPVIKGFDVVPFLKSGKASRTKPAIESEVVKGLEERFIVLRAENERLVDELAELAAEALDRPAAGEEVEALRAELAEVRKESQGWQDIAKTNGDQYAAAIDNNRQLQQELDEAKAMIAALTAPQTAAAPEVPAIPSGAAGPKGGK